MANCRFTLMARTFQVEAQGAADLVQSENDLVPVGGILDEPLDSGEGA